MFELRELVRERASSEPSKLGEIFDWNWSEVCFVSSLVNYANLKNNSEINSLRNHNPSTHFEYLVFKMDDQITKYFIIDEQSAILNVIKDGTGNCLYPNNLGVYNEIEGRTFRFKS